MRDILDVLTEFASVKRTFLNPVYGDAANEIISLREKLLEARNLLEEWYVSEDPRNFDIEDWATRVHTFLAATTPDRLRT